MSKERKVYKKSRILSFCLSIPLLIIVLSTCEIGLGDSVDTKPPTLSVDYPPSSAVIRGTFVIAGNASDETRVDSIKVNLYEGTEAKTSALIDSWNTTADRTSGSWRVTIPNERVYNEITGGFTAPIADGSYLVTVTAIDTAERKTTAKISYFIDNTPPILKIAQPSTTGTTSVTGSRFGTAITFKGDLWDAGYGGKICERIEFSFYDPATGTFLGSDSQSNPGSVINYTIRDEVFQLLIAGMSSNPLTEDEKIRTLSYTITAYDHARIYMDPADKTGQGNGNANEYIFLSSDINSLLYNTSLNPNLEELCNWHNDPDCIPSEVAKADFINTRIPSTVSESFDSAEYGNFSVSPYDKSPVIDIAGLTPGHDDYTVNVIASQSILPIKITPGPDATPISVGSSGQPYSVRIRLTGEGASPGLWDTLPGPQNANSPIQELSGTILINYEVAADSGNYELEIDALDTAGLQASNAVWRFSINAGAPILESVIPQNLTDKNATVKIRPQNNQFNVIIKGRDDQNLSLTVQEVTETGDLISTLFANDTSYSASPETVDGRLSFTWEKTISAPAAGEKKYVSFQLSDGKFSSGKITRSFITDLQSPVLSWAAVNAVPVTPSVTVFAQESIISIEGWADEDLTYARVAYTASADTVPGDSDWTAVEILTSSENAPAGSGLSGLYKKFSIRLPIGTDEQLYHIWYGLADDALDESGGYAYTPSAKFCIVGLDKSSPQIAGTKLILHADPPDPLADEESPIAEQPLTVNRLFSLTGTVSDSYGIASVSIEKNGTAVSSGAIVLTDIDSASKTFTYKETDTASGTYTYKIIVTDMAGKITSAERTVILDTDGPDIEVINLTDGMAITSTSYRITGTASDTSGLASEHSVQYSLNCGAWADVDTMGVSWSHTVSGLTEGPGQKIQFRATDKGGNVSITSEFAFGLDLYAPVLTVTDYDTLNNSIKKADFSISGTARDTSGIKTLSISYDAGTTWNTISFTPPSSEGDTISWNVTVPVPSDGSGDGQKAVRVRAADNYDKETIVSLSVLFDSSAPTFIVQNLVDGQLITSASFLVKGTWSDNGGSGTGSPATVEYRIGSGSWTSFAALTASTWQDTITFSEGLRQTFAVRAADAAGNVSAAEVFTLNVDTAVPSVTLLHDGSSDWSGNVYKKNTSGFILSGQGQDSLNIDRVELSVNPAIVGINLTQTPTGTTIIDWATDAIIPSDGTYVFTAIATDMAARTASLSGTIIYDKTPPEITVANLSNNDSIETANFVIRGSVTDATSGLADGSMQYSLNGGSWTGIANMQGVTWSQEVTGLTEGAGQAIKFKVEDKAGNVRETDAISFGLDLNPPSLTIDSIDTLNNSIRRADFGISGTAQDGNGITKLEISYDAGSTWTAISFTPPNPNGETVNWTHTVPVAANGANDGQKTIRVRATDAYNKETTLQFSVLFDSSAPTFIVQNLVAASQLITEAPYLVKGTWSDNGGSGTGSPAKVEYSFDNSDWVSFSTLNAATWEGNVSFTEGMGQTLYIRATDAIGNVSASELFTLNVDTDLPYSTFLHDGSGDWTGTVYKNSAAGFVLNGKAQDSHKLKELSLAASPAISGLQISSVYGNNDREADWTTGSVSPADGTYLFTLTVTDIANRTSTISNTVVYDKTAPSLEIISVSPMITDGTQNTVNGKVTLSLNVSDSGGLDGVKYFLRNDGITPSYSDNPASYYGAALASAPWQAGIDTRSISDGNWILWVIARDRAGNETVRSMDLHIDQDSDKPTAAITSPGAGEQISADMKIRGTVSDDDGITAAGAVLYIKKQSDASYTSLSLGREVAAGQVYAFAYDLSSYLAQSGNGEGIYSMYLSVTDDASKKNGLAAVIAATDVQTFVYDITSPVIGPVSVSPSKSAFKGGDTIEFSWTTTDATAITHTVDIDGTVLAVTETGGTYKASYTVPDNGASGTVVLTVSAADSVGRTATKTAAVKIDTVKPTVENNITLDPVFIGVSPNGTFTVKLIAYDDTGIDNVQIAFSTDDSTYGSWINTQLLQGSYIYEIDSTDYFPVNDAILPNGGILYCKAQAFDTAGNVSSSQSTPWEITVNQDDDKPVVNIISPVSDTAYGSTVQISGTATDDDNLLKDLNNAILAAAIEIVYRGSSLSNPVTVNPATINGSGKNATWNYTLTLDDGTYYVKARAQDENGLWGDYTAEVSFTVSTTAPNLTVNEMPLSEYRQDKELTLTGRVTSSLANIQYVYVQVNGQTYNAVTTNSTTWNGSMDIEWECEIPDLGTDGLKTIQVFAADVNNYVVSRQLSTTLDNTEPIAAFDEEFRDNPSGSFLDTDLLNGVVRVSGTVTELNLRDTNPIEISMGDGVWKTVTGTYIWTYVWDTTKDFSGNSIADGTYTLSIRATDKAGNTKTETKTVTVDQSADIPQLTTSFTDAPSAADAHLNSLSSLLRISGTLSDDDGFIKDSAVKIYLDGGTTPVQADNSSGKDASWTYTWSSGSLSSGVHYLVIQVTDRNGASVTTDPVYFLVDYQNPVITLNTPVIGLVTKTGTLSISGTVTDDGGFGTSPVTISLTHSNTESNLHGANITAVYNSATGAFEAASSITNDSKDGTLFINVIATDRSGKQGTLTRPITVDITAPGLTLTYPTPPAIVNGLIRITGISDDLNGIDETYLALLDPVTKQTVSQIMRAGGSSATNWQFEFNSASYTNSASAEQLDAEGKLWKVYLKLYTIDKAGNQTTYQMGGEDYLYLTINTDADKPTISVTQPKDGETLGGLINMFGSATDDDGPVMWVEIQLDFDGDGLFDKTRDLNKNGVTGSGTEFAMASGQTVRVGNRGTNNSGYADDDLWEDESAWYVFPVNNNVWALEMNTLGELYKDNTGGTGTINMRVRSRDINGLEGDYLQIQVTLDETFPRIEDISPGDQSYQNGVFNLTASFRDNTSLDLGSTSSIIRINVNNQGYTNLAAGTNSGAGWTGTLTKDLNDDYDLDLTVNTNTIFPNASGILYVTLYVKDSTNYVNQKNIEYRIDNQPPDGSWSTRVGAPDGLNIYNGQILLNASQDVSFIEGDYSDTGAVSGVDRVEVYFVKDGELRNIRSYGSQPVSSSAEAATEIDIFSNGAWTVQTQNLPLIQHSAALDDYVISINTPHEMSSLTTGTDLDGDGYYEYMGAVSGAERWRLFFDSSNLPDGEVDIHYVIYDLAGNSIHKARRGFISNFGPKLERIYTGSDYNMDGTVVNTADGITEVFDYYNPSTSVDRWTANKPVVVKNGKLFLGVDASDKTGNNQGIASIEIYELTGNTLIETIDANGSSQVSVAETIDIALPAGLHTLEIVAKDNDGIPASHYVRINVYESTGANKPVITPLPHTVANSIPVGTGGSALGHIELAAENETGAWNSLKAAYGNDDDPKVSGSILLKGSIAEETVIGDISITAPGFGTVQVASLQGGRLVSSHTTFAIDTQTIDETGHHITYIWTWDSSTIPGTAGLDKTVVFNAGNIESKTADPVSLRYDVVPYITAMERNMEIFSDTPRSKQGRYLFFRSGTASTQDDLDMITVGVQGFNVYETGSTSVSFGGTNIPLAQNPPQTPAVGHFYVTIPADAKSGEVVLTVNGTEAVNNKNDNTKAWNIEATAAASLDGSDLWTDDRYVHIWQSDNKNTGTDTAANRGYFANSNSPMYPAMTIDPETGELYASWSNYASANVYFGKNNNANSNTARITASGSNNNTPGAIFTGYDPSEHTDIHFSTRPAVVWNANLHGGGTWSRTGAGGVFAWDQNTPNRTILNSASAQGFVHHVELLYHDAMLWQFTNQRIVTRGDDMHITYYDTDTKSLKYWHNTSGDPIPYDMSWINIDGGDDADDTTESTQIYTHTGTNRSVEAVRKSVGDFIGAGDDLIRRNGATADITSTVTGIIEYIVAVGDPLVQNETVLVRVSALDRIVNEDGSAAVPRVAAAGEFSAVDVHPVTGYPVIAYYDVTNQTVRLAHAKAVNPSAPDWKVQTVMGTGDPNRRYAGKYMTMRVDSEGYVHLAFYRNSSGDLIYMRSTNNPSDGVTDYTFDTSVSVDSIGSVGVWADLSLDSNNNPHISYLDSSMVNSFDGLKMAFYNPGYDAAAQKSPNNPGGWETMSVPVGYEVINARTSIENYTDNGGYTQFWSAAIGYASDDFYRIAYYIKE
ncbi:Ig-like domain-containing protein [Brucepastera parasyntrophica]|uniref:Ig-like domain-containing protein n=1 Tax=Brucepastera parasyntrophica TaxID=2880008 RepID=UPI00210D85B1|nr:Ig-like domain-containing protein [Brucepastera parasyntrophica]ULQ60973.1 Ig-like domain-containing protein [Brucepastera parasyntrophica]